MQTANFSVKENKISYALTCQRKKENAILSEPLRISYQDLAMALSAGKNILDTPVDSLCIPCIACSRPNGQTFQIHLEKPKLLKDVNQQTTIIVYLDNFSLRGILCGCEKTSR